MNTGRLVLTAFISALIVMILIYIWKKVLSKYNVPFLSTVAQEV